jgi:hypothetical protein
MPDTVFDGATPVIPECVSAEEAAKDSHPQPTGGRKHVFGKKRRVAILADEVAEAIRLIDGQK